MLGLLVLKSLYFFLPAYLANMAPIFVRKLSLLGRPVWEKGLGKNKTWRGVIVAILTGTVIFYLQKIAYQFGFTALALIDYSDVTILLGTLLGTGAIGGDLIKSYFKRRQKIPPGEKWVPWDQLDFVFGGLILSLFLYVPAAEVALIIVVISPLLHILFNLIGSWLKIRKSMWG